MKLGVVAALCCLWTASAQAQSALDRALTLPAGSVTLRAALDTVAARAVIKLSYSADALPLNREVSLTRGRTTVGNALRALLHDVPVSAVAIATDHVVLVPRPRPEGEPPLLDEVRVTGQPFDARTSRPTESIDVLSGEALERRNETTLAQALSGSVPGTWLWESPSAMAARYGSIRGASSFGVAYPKVYVDGVEVANPMFLTHIVPELIERIEVIRGPQGAATYGADAISGVINIVSRQRGATDAGSTVRSEFGVTQSAFRGPAAMQRHALALRRGNALRAGGVSVHAAASGDYIPNGYRREVQTTGDFRTVGSSSMVSITGRLEAKEAGVPVNPLLPNQPLPFFGPDQGKQALAMYSFSSVVKRTPSDDLLYSFSAGVDGYRLSNVHLDHTPFPLAVDSALRAASGGADRITLRIGSERRREFTESFDGRLTLGAEQSLLRDHSLLDGAEPDDSNAVRGRTVDWSSNAGVLARGELSWNDALFIAGGARVERLQVERRPALVALLPNLGVAARHDFSIVVATARASYGRAVRSPGAGARFAPFRPGFADMTVPETQSGVESGVDLAFGQLAKVQLTHFHQVASGLRLPRGDIAASGADPANWINAPLPLVGGAIRNTGWEARGSLSLGRLLVSGASTITESRVTRLADGYQGELRVGDRALGVPHTTRSLVAEWVGGRFSTAWTVTRASNWMQYDRLRIASVIDSAGASAVFTPQNLRDFWLNYPGNTRLRGTLVAHMPGGSALQLTGDNLTNVQTGEPDSMTILPGRSISLGIRARF